MNETCGRGRIGGVIDNDHLEIVGQKRAQGIEAGRELVVGPIVDDED